MFFKKNKKEKKEKKQQSIRVPKEVLFGIETLDDTVNKEENKKEERQPTTKSVTNVFVKEQVTQLDETTDYDETDANQLDEDLVEAVTKQTKEDINKPGLDTFFKNTGHELDKLKKSTKPKRQSKRAKRREKEFQDLKNRRVFKYQRKKYTKIEDFIAFLNEHYLDLDEIATSVLNDDTFFGWLQKKSGIFEHSIDEFKDIKEKIETK